LQDPTNGQYYEETTSVYGNAVQYTQQPIANGGVSIKDNKLDIGAYEFTINQPPTIDSFFAWSMVLDGVKYIKEGASCSDGVKDGNETGVDCGGRCKSCYSKNVEFTISGDTTHYAIYGNEFLAQDIFQIDGVTSDSTYELSLFNESVGLTVTLNQPYPLYSPDNGDFTYLKNTQTQTKYILVTGTITYTSLDSSKSLVNGSFTATFLNILTNTTYSVSGVIINLNYGAI